MKKWLRIVLVVSMMVVSAGCEEYDPSPTFPKDAMEAEAVEFGWIKTAGNGSLSLF